jgi:hypothetical protein
MTLKGRKIMNEALRRCKEVVVAYFKAIIISLSGGRA